MSEESEKGRLHGLPPLSELLPLGYLYLLLLGIASQSIFYGMLGINFLEYSDLLDVLISPISLVTGHLAILIVVLVVPILTYPYLLLMRRLAARKPSKPSNSHLITQPLSRLWLQATAGILFFAFLGLGLGGGTATRERISSGELRLDHRIVFLDGVVEEVDLIGKNTGYLFFARPGDTSITIAPVADNVRSIQVLPENVSAPAPTSASP